MKKTDFNKFIDILKKEVVPALGCTEPTAVAYAAAKAREILGETPEKVELILSGNVLKNAMSVGIPGTGMKGIDIATAVGIVAGDPSAGLEVLNNIKKEDIEKAKELLSKKFITRELSTLPNKLYIKVKVISKNNWASVEIKDFHTAITKIEKNDTIIFESKCDGEILEKIAGTQVDTGIFLSVKSIWKFIQEVPLEQILFMKDAIILNTIIAEEGLKNPYGLRVGQTRLK
ncbi:MAG: serine dehydratase subunit alpha family protein, partial [Fusobacteriaceae bacterium]